MLHIVLRSVSEECAGVRIQSVDEGRLDFMRKAVSVIKPDPLLHYVSLQFHNLFSSNQENT